MTRAAILHPKGLVISRVDAIMKPDFACAILETGIEEMPVLLVVSAYLDINKDEEEMLQDLEKISAFTKQKKIPLFMGVDSNAHSPFWGDTEANDRGEKWRNG